MTRRTPLTRDRIVDAAVRVADARGLAAVSMRNVAAELGVEAMSLYHHVANKEALLDELANWVFTQIEVPAADDPWREAMAARAASARTALARHPWSLGLVESRRSPGHALLRHHDAVLGNLLSNGFSMQLAAHAFSVLDAYVRGFVLTELNLPFEPGEDAEQFVAAIDEFLPAGEYPHLVALIEQQVRGQDYDYGDEFEFGLDLILDSLAVHRRRRR